MIACDVSPVAMFLKNVKVKMARSACWSRECVPGQLVRDPALAATTQRNPQQLYCCFGSSSPSEEINLCPIGWLYLMLLQNTWLAREIFQVGSSHLSSIPNLFLASGFSKKSQIGSCCCLHYTLLFLFKLPPIKNIDSKSPDFFLPYLLYLTVDWGG